MPLAQPVVALSRRANCGPCGLALHLKSPTLVPAGESVTATVVVSVRVSVSVGAGLVVEENDDGMRSAHESPGTAIHVLVVPGPAQSLGVARRTVGVFDFEQSVERHIHPVLVLHVVRTALVFRQNLLSVVILLRFPLSPQRLLMASSSSAPVPSLEHLNPVVSSEVSEKTPELLLA